MNTPASSPSLLARLSVAQRLWLALVIVILSLVGLISFSALRSANLQAETDAISAAMTAKQAAADRWAGLTTATIVRIQASAISTDPAVEASFKETIASTISEISTVQKAIEAMELSAEDKAQMATIAADRKASLDSLAKIREIKAGGGSAVEEVQKNFNPIVTRYLASLAKFSEMQIEAKKKMDAAMGERRKVTIRIALAVVAVVVAVMIGGALLLIRSIKQPLSQAIELAEQIAAGDLSSRVHVKSHDEFGQLLGALDKMVTQLRSVVGEVRQGVESVSTASNEIATGNHDLSARTEQTASNLQQTASSMEELTSTVANSADVARQANQLAASAAEAATRGGEVVSQVVSNMDEITASSRKISDIIGTIDGIAFQTNILALNAAVEAARAGEQGRGFAVVAGEVRTLAQRSAEAAKEIKSLIGASVERVESGAGLVAQTGSVMEEIVTSVRRVTDMIGEIASAATEQRDGISQVNMAVNNLDQMTQQNAALVEESAAAAQSLREQSARLAEVVSVFKIDSSSAAVAALARSYAPVAKPAAKPVAKAAPKPAAKPAARAAAPKPAPKAPAVSKPAAAPAPVVAKAPADDGDWETF